MTQLPQCISEGALGIILCEYGLEYAYPAERRKVFSLEFLWWWKYLLTVMNDCMFSFTLQDLAAGQ